MFRIVAVLALSTACTPAQASVARRIGMIAAIGGVVGTIGGAVTGPVTHHGAAISAGFTGVAVGGVIAYAIGEQNDPTVSYTAESIEQRNHRWAKILTERAQGAARMGKCPRVRRLEAWVNKYDPELHDFVFMKDPEILRCLAR